LCRLGKDNKRKKGLSNQKGEKDAMQETDEITKMKWRIIYWKIFLNRCVRFIGQFITYEPQPNIDRHIINLINSYHIDIITI
jgi:hypothetical protein